MAELAATTTEIPPTTTSLAATATATPPAVDPNAAKTPEELAAEAAKTPEQKAADAEAARLAAEAAKPAEFKPLVADQLKIPDGFKVDEPTRDAFLAVMNDQKLSPEQRAQGLLDLHMKMSSEAANSGQTQWDNLQKDWQKGVKEHPDFGGPKFDETQATMGKILDEYGSPALRQVLDLTGLGNHPEFYSFVMKFAPHVTEGKAVNPGGGGQQGEKSLAQLMYPSMANK